LALPQFLRQAEDALGALGCAYELIFVDDGSTDGSADFLAGEAKGARLIRNAENLGYGGALKRGIIAAKGEVVCIIDADNSYPLSGLKQMYPHIDGNDMVVAARTALPGERKQIFPLYQRLANRLVCALLGFIFKRKVPDINSGLRTMKKAALMSYLGLLPDGFSFTASITLLMLLERRSIKYIPVAYARRTGRTKVSVLSYASGFLRSYCRIFWLKRSLIRG
jgi:glycosyltransferase involved in cell wall biosynthesis